MSSLTFVEWHGTSVTALFEYLKTSCVRKGYFYQICAFFDTQKSLLAEHPLISGMLLWKPNQCHCILRG